MKIHIQTKQFSSTVIISALIIATTFLVIGIVAFKSLPLVNATVYGVNWQAGRIIDDNIFYNNNAMSVDDIQTFLNQKVPSCDTSGTQQYNISMTDKQYAATQGWPGPSYVCLRDYYQVPRSDQNINNLTTNVIPNGAISAAQIIKNAADTYGISPQALLVTLQKESNNLLNDSWPLPSQYKNAMGYGCPDSAPCDPQYEGFYNQMTNAARQFKLYKSSPSNYRYQPFKNNAISYQANAPSCGSSTVYIDSYATAGLYNYTPYQPNQPALNNLYGTGDSCSAYGNRNFWRIFNDWFGSTREIYRYSSETLVGPTGSAVTANVNTDNIQSLTIGDSMYTFYNNKTTGTLEYALFKNNTWSRRIMDGPSAQIIGASQNAINIGSITSFDYLGEPQVFYTDTTTKTVRHAFMTDGTYHIETLDGTVNSVIKSTRQLGSAISGFSFVNGQIQLYYYDTGSNSLVHTWWNGQLWGSETLDGTVNSVIKSTRQLGSAISGFSFVNGQIQLYYYDTGSNSLVHTWWNGQLWGSETLDGTVNSVIKSTRQLGSAISGFSFVNGQIQLYYYDTGNGELIHTWFNNQWNTEVMDGSASSLFGNTINAGKRITTQVINGSIFVMYYDDATGFSGRSSSWRIAYTNGSWITNTLDGGSIYSRTGSAVNIPISTPSSTLYNGSIQVFYADNTGNLKHAWLNRQN
jgi:hypothetical protein